MKTTVKTTTATSVFCACGAQWHGQYTSSIVIASHKQRWPTQARGCGRISHDDFKQRFRCQCPTCRRRAWRRR